jgi:hypothetical protein
MFAPTGNFSQLVRSCLAFDQFDGQIGTDAAARVRSGRSYHRREGTAMAPKRWLAVPLRTTALAVSLVWGTVVAAQSFDSTAWRDEAQIQRGVRLGMADRLIAQGTLLGKTRAEVVEMLGEPPRTGYFADWDLVYWLGPERGFISIDSEWLVLRLSADGRVTDNRIVRD